MKYINLTCPFCGTKMRLNGSIIKYYSAKLKLDYFRCEMCSEKIENYLDKCIFVDDNISWRDYTYIDHTTYICEDIKVVWLTDKPIEKYLSEIDMRILEANHVITKEECAKYLEEWRKETRQYIDALLSDYDAEAETQGMIQEGKSISEKVDEYMKTHIMEFIDVDNSKESEYPLIKVFNLEYDISDDEDLNTVVNHLNSYLDELRENGYRVKEVHLIKTNIPLKLIIITHHN
jgi:hypothetical protein